MTEKKLNELSFAIFNILLVGLKSLGYKKLKKPINTVCRHIQQYADKI